jgi:hypothetical protein
LQFWFVNFIPKKYNLETFLRHICLYSIIASFILVARHKYTCRGIAGREEDAATPNSRVKGVA